MQDILTYVRETDIPERPFTIGFPGCPAVVLVDAKPILAAVIEKMSKVRETADA